MTEYIRKNLAERLIEAGLITEEQFQTALKKHQETKVILRQVLIDMGFITEEKLLEFMSASLGIPYMSDLTKKIVDLNVIQLVPEKISREYLLLPLFRVKDVLTVAMTDPLDIIAIDDLHQITKSKIEPVLCNKEDLAKAIDKYYGTKNPLDEFIDLLPKESEDLEIVKPRIEEKIVEEIEGVDEAPIIRLVNAMIIQAVKEGASDIHVEPEENNVIVRYRVDGMLRETMVPPKRFQASIISRLKILSGMDIAVKRAPQDGRFKVKAEGRTIDVRVSSIPTIYGEKVVMRLLDRSSIFKGLEDLGFSEECMKKFNELIHRPYGIILVTGPTGSGKTTTLYVALQAINSPDKNIITIEEPVEYNLPGINQIPVNAKAGVTFAKGLRSILRQDPDVIMVGEMRDLETAEIAVRAALTGHLVFSTLHTNNAPSSIVRMVDMGVPSYLVASSVCGVLAQRLVRVLCPVCKEPYHPAQEVLDRTGLKDKPQDYTFYRTKGCDHCGKTGFKGRTALFELMIIDKELRNLIHGGKLSDKIQETAQEGGTKELWEDGVDKILKGITTLEEVTKAALAKEEAK